MKNEIQMTNFKIQKIKLSTLSFVLFILALFTMLDAFLIRFNWGEMLFLFHWGILAFILLGFEGYD